MPHLDQALGFEPLQNLDDRRARHAELNGKCTARRQPRPAGKLAGEDHAAQLALELTPKRDRAASIQLDPRQDRA
jgi:hypothetical protein